MIVAWLVITLMIAAVAGVITAGTMGHEHGAGFAFMWGFWVVCAISFWIAVAYIALHFVGKYW